MHLAVLIHSRTGRLWLAIVGMAILCLSIAIFAFLRMRSHESFGTDDLYWVMD